MQYRSNKQPPNDCYTYKVGDNRVHGRPELFRQAYGDGLRLIFGWEWHHHWQ